jgi:hypothetical protein
VLVPDKGSKAKPEATAAEKLFIGPHGPDGMMRQLVTMVWLLLPQDKKTVNHLESEVRRIVDRALKDAHEDARAFGIG